MDRHSYREGRLEALLIIPPHKLRVIRPSKNAPVAMTGAFSLSLGNTAKERLFGLRAVNHYQIQDKHEQHQHHQTYSHADTDHLKDLIPIDIDALLFEQFYPLHTVLVAVPANKKHKETQW